MKKQIEIVILLLISSVCFSQTKQEVLKELYKQNIPCAEIVLAQARLESGNFKSDFYLKTNNLFGIKKNGKYVKYRTWKHSILDYKRCISNRYTGGNYYRFLRRINYASDVDYIKKLKEIAK